MTFEKKQIVIPSWLVSVIAPLFLVVIGYTLSVTRLNTRSEAKIHALEARVMQIDYSKASKEVVERVEGALLRIEGKLDTHIMQHQEP